MSRSYVLQNTGSSSHPSTSQNPPRSNPYYSPHHDELRPGASNRLILALRSGVPSEVDWALPRIVCASYDHTDDFRLEKWVDSVGALLYWPEIFVSGLERLSADGGAVGPGIQGGETLDTVMEKRATDSLCALRNASCATGNAKLVCRATTINLLKRYFALPPSYLLEVVTSYPEITSHLLIMLANVIPHLQPQQTAVLSTTLSDVLPVLLVESRDKAIIEAILPVLLQSAALPSLPPLPSALISHLLQLLAVSPPSPMLDLILDLLLTLSSSSIYSRQILASPYFAKYVRTIAGYLEYHARPFQARWDSSAALAGKVVRNPASPACVAELASTKRARERDDAQRRMEAGEHVAAEVGDSPPVLAETIKAKLYGMPEPKRSIAWMHETFVYSSSSQLLQVTFWHAYRDFFTHPSTVQQLLSASEVIKNVTVAFPGASAKIWVDGTGQQKFVIAGMGFRKAADEDDRFACHWRGCPGSKQTSPSTLYTHLLTHFQPAPTTCAWSTCSAPFSTPHILTHIPPLQKTRIPETITLHPSVPDHLASSPRPTLRPPAPLPRSVRLAFEGKRTALDARNNPTGPPFLAALILRNLARALRGEIAIETPEDKADPEHAEARGMKKKHLVEERYGLPIPESVLREEEEEERNLSKDEEEGLTKEQRERAVEGFRRVEGRVLGVMEDNMVGLGAFLSLAVGW